MVVRQWSPSESIAMLEMTESSFEELEGMAAVLTDKKDVKLVPWTNTYDMRPLTLAALAKSSTSTRPNPALNRMRCRTITSAAKSLDILRQNLQAAINKEIDLVIKKYIEKFFQPAMKNIRDNLGAGSVTEELVREVCRAMLEGAKQMYCSVQALHGSSTSSPSTGTPPQFQAPQQVPTRKRKLSTGEKSNLTWPEIYPPHIKWDPSRVNKDTQFILSTTASKVLGLGSIRGRLSLKHPELVRYSLDQDDREWLLTAGVSGIFQGTPNIALVLMDDIVQLANWEEYRSSPLLCVHDLKGFCVPDFIQRKVRAYMTLMRSTKYIEPSPPPQPPPPHPQQYTSSPPPPLSPGPCLSPAPSLSPPPLSPPHSCSLSPIPLSPPCLSSSSSLPSPSLPSTSFPSPSLPSPSLSSTSLALSSLSLPSETTSLSAEDLPIQMSIDVECLPSSVAPLSLLDSGGLIEFDLPFFSLITGDEED